MDKYLKHTVNTYIMAYTTQNSLLLTKLMAFYHSPEILDKMLNIINGESKISLRIVDWFSTNYAKKYYTVYKLKTNNRFKVYHFGHVIRVETRGKERTHHKHITYMTMIMSFYCSYIFK